VQETAEELIVLAANDAVRTSQGSAESPEAQVNRVRMGQRLVAASGRLGDERLEALADELRENLLIPAADWQEPPPSKRKPGMVARDLHHRVGELLNVHKKTEST
jgi:hypothetical protein